MAALEGGAALPVTTGGTGQTEARAALPVYVVPGGPVIGQRARRVVVVTSGPVAGGAAKPVYDAGAGALYSNEAALPVFVVSGSLGGGGAVPFTPTSIAGLQAWFKADALALANNDPVSSWTDSSGLGHHAVQASGTLQPLYKTNQQNSLPGILFDGVDNYLATGLFTLNQPLTIFAVMKLVTSSAGVYMWDGSTNNFCGIRQGTGGHALMHSGTNGPDLTLGTVAVHLVTSVYNGASSTAALDGGSDVTGDVGANAMGQISLGVRGNKAGAWSNTLFCEFLVYNTALSGANQALVKGYLNTKYALF